MGCGGSSLPSPSVVLSSPSVVFPSPSIVLRIGNTYQAMDARNPEPLNCQLVRLICVDDLRLVYSLLPLYWVGGNPPLEYFVESCVTFYDTKKYTSLRLSHLLPFAETERKRGLHCDVYVNDYWWKCRLAYVGTDCFIVQIDTTDHLYRVDYTDIAALDRHTVGRACVLAVDGRPNNLKRETIPLEMLPDGAAPFPSLLGDVETSTDVSCTVPFVAATFSVPIPAATTNATITTAPVATTTTTTAATRTCASAPSFGFGLGLDFTAAATTTTITTTNETGGIPGTRSMETTPGTKSRVSLDRALAIIITAHTPAVPKDVDLAYALPPP